MSNLTLGAISSNSYNAIGGGTPCVFIDGHAEMLAAYQIINFLNTPGRPTGSSPFWTSPTYPAGGYNVKAYANSGATVYTLSSSVAIP
jgi:hypothetical protein